MDGISSATSALVPLSPSRRMELADSFLSLANGFRALQASDDRIGEESIDSVSEMAAKALKRGVEYGLWQHDSLPWPEAPKMQSDDQTKEWSALWRVFVVGVAYSHPDQLPSNPAAFRNNSRTVSNEGKTIVVHGSTKQSDWPLRAQRYATVCEWVARKIIDECKADGESGGADGNDAIAKRPPAKTDAEADSRAPRRRSFRTPTEQELNKICGAARTVFGTVRRYSLLVGGQPHTKVAQLPWLATVNAMSFAASELELLFNPTKRPFGERRFNYLHRNVTGWPLNELSESLNWIHSLLGGLLKAMRWEEIAAGHLITYEEADTERDVLHGGDVFRLFDPATHVWPLLDGDLERQLALNLRELIGIVQTAEWQPSHLELECRTVDELRQQGNQSPVKFTINNGVTAVSYEEQQAAALVVGSDSRVGRPKQTARNIEWLIHFSENKHLYPSQAKFAKSKRVDASTVSVAFRDAKSTIIQWQGEFLGNQCTYPSHAEFANAKNVDTNTVTLAFEWADKHPDELKKLT